MTKKRRSATMVNIRQMSFDFDAEIQELFLNGDIHNIRFMLPKLFDSQHEDIQFAERRFEKGKGYLFTNGTGTGKTYVGLGTAYRFHMRGKRNILIVVPTEKKCTDWIEDGASIGLIITMLKDTRDCGHGIVVTTYANFYQNDALNTRLWDLIIYDESHYLNQNLSGKDTVYIEKHKLLANVPSKAKEKAHELVPMEKPVYDSSSEFFKRSEIYDRLHLEKTRELVESTKVLFLSATPFAYHKSIIYADGCLFDIEEKIEKEKDKFQGYNNANGFNKFLVENFGYQMKYNKITTPDTGVDINLMERNFFEKFKEMGVMSTRILELEYDYSRHFVTLDSDLGEFINTGMELFYQDDFRKKYPTLCLVSGKKYNYNYVNQLLECIKAKEIHTRIQQHLDLGRKVVVFHSYNNSTVEHPFHFNPELLLSEETRHLDHKLRQEVALFREQYPQYYNLDLSHLKNTREAIIEHFPDTKQFNGTISKKLRSKYLDDFNNDYGYTKILLVQEKAGKEGLSAHDKTGKYQRVLLQLGLPTQPTTAIQVEGRTYRQGLMSNSPYEYMTLQTNFERRAFGEIIAKRSRTAENLAMGNLARNLEIAFKEGYIDSSYDPPSLEQGTGGKEKDKFDFVITTFEKAKTYYYSRAKRNSKNKAKEGIDYFATPEPLGLKIVEWLDPKPEEKGLEPSAGHGAISRWFPETTTNHFVEPSFNLSSELAINSSGTIRNGTFEEHSRINKYNFIAMNPPFGFSGKTAMEHIEKACVKHSGMRFRLISIIPGGPAMEKRIEEFFASEDGSNFIMLWQIRLPNCVFERAGTNIACKVIKIVYKSPMLENYMCRKLDLSYIQSVNEFFDAIEELDM